MFISYRTFAVEDCTIFSEIPCCLAFRAHQLSGSLSHVGPRAAPAHLHAAAERAGLNLDYLDTVIEADPDRFENIITENEAAQKAAGHWGVPLMVFDGEPFFGQDRVDALVWRMRQNGLQERS